MPAVSLRLIVAILAVVALALPAAAAAEDPPFVGWTSLLPALSIPYDVESPDDCIAGRTQCVDKVIREMTKRFDPLASSCDHNSIFALAYLRTTEEYRRAIADPTFFADTPFVNHVDVVFARYYFAAYDAWAEARIAAVPAAWRIAFDAARNREISASGNLLLGINGHVQRDLPFVLYSIGLVSPEGSTRKSDLDRVNEILNRVTDGLIAEIARRFDPTIDDADLPGTLDDFAIFQLVPTWREKAWRNAELLAAAATPEERDLVAQRIEDDAAAEAEAIKTLTRYWPGSGGSAARDAYCAANWMQ